MKRENILITEDYATKRVAAVKFIAPGNIPFLDCSIHFSEEGNDVTIQNCIIKDNNIVKCSPEDTYDFETGALIALMKMCGRDKVIKACDELYKDDNYKNALQEVTENNEKLIEENNHLKYVKSCNESTIESLENTRDLLINKNNELIEENKKHQHENDLCKCSEKALKCSVDYLNKTIAKLNKEAYNTKLPVWQKEALNQMYGKPRTKREEMWEKILGVTKGSSVEIKVVKQDITTFLRELQDKRPEVRWNGSDCLPVDLSVPDWFKHDYIYFFLFRNYDKGNLRLCYGVKPHSCPSWVRIKVDYLPPMHWDLFKKGRLAVKVTYENYKEFYEACEKELGKKPTAMYCGDFTVSICKKDGNFEIFTMEDQKKTGRKIVNWEDVR